VRRAIWLLVLAVAIWFAASVPLGGRTLLEHIRHIGHAEDLDEAKQRAGELVDTAKPAAQKISDQLTPEMPDGEDRHWQDRSLNRYRK
jgi:hypothetical protein